MSSLDKGMELSHATASLRQSTRHGTRPIRGRVRGCLLGLLAVLMVPAVAQDVPLDVTDIAPPRFENFTPQDGLSDEIWSTVGFDADGFAWAGSASSLAWFDGYRWHPAGFDAARSLVRDMVATPDGTLWAMFEREGLARWDGQRWQLDGPTGLGQRFSSWTLPDGRREVGVAQGGRMLRWTAAGWIDDPADAALPPGRAIKMTRTESLFGEPREWLARAPGQLYWRPAGRAGAAWQPFDVPGFEIALFTDMLRTQDGDTEELWLLSYGSGLVRITESGQRVWRASTDGLPSEAIYSAVATRDDQGHRSLWVASRAGLLRMEGERIRVYDRADGLPSSAIRGIKLQRTAAGHPVLWLATEGGIVRTHLKPNAWRTVSRLGADDNGVFGMLQDRTPEGGQRVWFGSARDGLVRLDDRGERRVEVRTDERPPLPVTAMFLLDRGDGRPPWRLVSSDTGPMLEILDDLSLRAVDAPWSELGSSAVSAVAREGEDGMEHWFGTRSAGLWRLDANGWTRMAEPQPPTALFGLLEQTGPDGRRWLWLASERGVGRWDGERLVFLPTSIEAAPGGYRHVALIEHGGRTELWASGLRDGLVRFDVSDPARPDRLLDGQVPPPPDPTVYSVHQDSLGRIYLCTNNGVQALMPTSSGRYSERVYRRGDGLVHDECNTGAQAIDAFDRYWVGTLGGVSLFDPALAVRIGTVQRHPLFVTGAVADGQPIAGRSPTELVVPAGTREVRVDFVQRSNEREAETRYRSWLVGYEPPPAEDAWRQQPGRRFGRLPPGAYTLRIEARDYAGVESEALELPFRVQPLWWQRDSLKALAGLALLALLVLLMATYTRRLRRRRDALEFMISERTSELNAANARLTELSYRDPLTGLANRRSLTAEARELLDLARHEGVPIGLVLLDIDHFKPYNDSNGHLAGDSALQVVAQLMREGVRGGDRVARFGGEEFVCLLPGADAETAWRVAEQLRMDIEIRTRDLLDAGGVTVSAGVVARVPATADELSELLHRADQALYAAKHGGRNRVERADDGPQRPSSI